MEQAETDRNGLALYEINDPVIKELVGRCDADLASALRLTPDEIEVLKNYINRLGVGINFSSIMVCAGEMCPLRSKCPLYQIKKPPLGKECPFERYAMEKWFVDYVTSLKIDLTDKVERSLVLELVEADIIQARANVMIGEQGFIMENPVGINEDTGEVVMHKEEHIAVAVRERAQMRRDKILKQLVATRESKIKASEVTKGKDPTEYLANLRNKFNEIAAKYENSKVIDAVVHERKNEKNEQSAEDDAPF